ncbi:MAG: hypothetical protein HY717_05335 [Planctomycetes bacterium]|nr:hypothetical protein [Planctomycetota bacterium]
MTRKNRSGLATLIGSLIAAWLVPVLSQERSQEVDPPSRRIPPEELEALRLQEGERVVITGKYLGLVDQEIHLFGAPYRLILADTSLARQLLHFKTERDNLSLSGFLRPGEAPAAGGEPAVFEVENIETAPGDVELYGERLKLRLSQPDSSDELIQLAAWIAQIQRRFPDRSLLPLSRQAAAEGYKGAAAELKPDDGDGHFALLQELFKKVADPECFGELLRQLAARFSAHPGIQQKLKELGYRQIGQSWLNYSEFKKGEGFVWHLNRWVKKLDKEMFEVVEALPEEGLTNAILRSRTDKEYANLSRQGEITRGMTPKEVAEAIGFPDRVRRQNVKDLEVTQWDYGDRRIYFLKGELLISWSDDKEDSELPLADAVRKAATGAPEPRKKKKN